MPIPKPGKDEKENDFISRCMSDKVMNKEYPDEKQRAAICFSQWKQKEEFKDVTEKPIKRDEKGRMIIAENVNLVFTGLIEEVKNVR